MKTDYNGNHLATWQRSENTEFKLATEKLDSPYSLYLIALATLTVACRCHRQFCLKNIANVREPVYVIARVTST